MQGEDLNCAEMILIGGNESYGLDLDKKTFKLAAGFGGGMGVESTCGALTGSIMVLGSFLVKERAHTSNIGEISEKFLGQFEKEMGSIKCSHLRGRYRTEEEGCNPIIFKAAEVLDKIVEESLNKETKTKES